jgi:hypothetical protein
MNDNRQVQRFTLGPRELLVIDDARDQWLTCESGELWITQDGDRRDVILQPDQTWRIDRRGPLVLSAFKPAVATLAHTEAGKPASVPHRDSAASLLAMIRRWRFPALASFPTTLLR